MTKAIKPRYMVGDMPISTVAKYSSSATIEDVCFSAMKASRMDSVSSFMHYTVIQRRSGTYTATKGLFMGLEYKGCLYTDKLVVLPGLNIIFAEKGLEWPLLKVYGDNGNELKRIPCKTSTGERMPEQAALSAIFYACCFNEPTELQKALIDRFDI